MTDWSLRRTGPSRCWSVVALLILLVLSSVATAAVDYGHLHCHSTDALSLGYQCSATHAGFVKPWFGRNLNALLDQPLSNRYTIKDVDIKWFCESADDKSSARSESTSLRVRTNSNRVTVDGEINSRNRNGKVGMYAFTSKAHVSVRFTPSGSRRFHDRF
jgi:hypothetical protein